MRLVVSKQSCCSPATPFPGDGPKARFTLPVFKVGYLCRGYHGVFMRVRPLWHFSLVMRRAPSRCAVRTTITRHVPGAPVKSPSTATVPQMRSLLDRILAGLEDVAVSVGQNEKMTIVFSTRILFWCFRQPAFRSSYTSWVKRIDAEMQRTLVHLSKRS